MSVADEAMNVSSPAMLVCINNGRGLVYDRLLHTGK